MNRITVRSGEKSGRLWDDTGAWGGGEYGKILEGTSEF
jgi:hypothetical protein